MYVSLIKVGGLYVRFMFYVCIIFVHIQHSITGDFFPPYTFLSLLLSTTIRVVGNLYNLYNYYKINYRYLNKKKYISEIQLFKICKLTKLCLKVRKIFGRI